MTDTMMEQFEVFRSPLSWCVVLLGLAAYIFSKWKVWRTSKLSAQSRTSLSLSKKPEQEYSAATYYNIEPLPNFDITQTPPLKLRPFRPKFHMTMAIENVSISDLIAMDNTFSSRCAIRTHLIDTQHHEVLACNPKAFPAVTELYTWLTRTYLPTRFPTVYTLHPKHLQNEVTQTSMPLTPPTASHALELLGKNTDSEFLLLLPSSLPGEEQKYRLEAFVTCFPAGFNTRSKLNQLLSEIHSPVPGYAQKLEKSMDRFFANMPVGKVVRRANWSVTTTGELFCLKGSHMSKEEMESVDKEGAEEVDLRSTVLRCERQTLHRLPESRALVFAFKTYQYPIRELRDEGSGEELAEAIDGLATGSVPDITVYKRQVIWGEKVKAYLKGEIEIDA